MIDDGADVHYRAMYLEGYGEWESLGNPRLTFEEAQHRAIQFQSCHLKTPVKVVKVTVSYEDVWKQDVDN